MKFLKLLVQVGKAAAKPPRKQPPPPRPKQREAVGTRASQSAGTVIACGEGSYRFEVVGEARYQDALSQIVGGQNRDGHGYECIAQLVTEPDNRFDPNAIQVVIGSKPVGYIPKEGTARLHAAMAVLGPLSCRARIDGGWRTNQHDAGHFGVKLAIPNRGKITVA